MPRRELIIEGARQNNLRNISLRLPHNRVIAVTGVSGSGKSSLAFDTLFAEGQWRFIESLSTYARLFLEKLDRPEVDAIRNIRPAIALEQKNPVKGSRSTVGTLTELYDLFRILYAKIATPYCPKCGREIRHWDPSQIKAELLEHYHDERALVMFETKEPAESLVLRGFRRFLIDGEVREAGDLPMPAAKSAASALPRKKKGSPAVAEQPVATVVLDRLVIRDEPRLADSLENAWREGREKILINIVRTGDDGAVKHIALRFSSKNRCDDCGIDLPEPSPLLFSFNHPLCACPECKGFGNILKYDEDLIVTDPHISLADGAIEIWEKPGYRWWKDQLLKGARKSDIDVSKPFNMLSRAEHDLIFSGSTDFYGIDSFFEELEGKRYKLHVRVFLSRYRSPVTCPSCKGKRLCEEALSYKIDRLDIAELSLLPLRHLSAWFEHLDLSPMERDISKEVIRQIMFKLRFLAEVGLDYLTPSRQTKTLSGGEYQRVNLSNQLASALTGTLYVLDEPTIGLHPRDTERISAIMRRLAGLGNTIVVVEHDRDVIAASDWVVELGPGGGREGGTVIFSGPIDEFRSADTLTASYLRGDPDRSPLNAAEKKRKNGGAITHGKHLTLRGASGHNLRNVTLRIPLETLTTVTGVSGSGKSSLVVETLHHAVARLFRLESDPPLQHAGIEGMDRIRGIRLIDQSPLGRTPRSNPLTYLKLFEPIRKLYSQQPESRAHGYTPGFFSFNIPGGRCETCKGEGYQRLEMYFFEDIFVKCEDCKGRRYSEAALRVAYKGKPINDILGMTVDEAFVFFGDIAELRSKLELMRSIGLGYLVLGQSATTLSGGEAQRLKLCAELSHSASRDILYILDEPTVGLHHRDVLMLIGVVRRLVEAGNTVLVIEHNPDVIERADWVVDLGPGGGEDGGTIVFEGTPEALKNDPSSHTARYLRGGASHAS